MGCPVNPADLRIIAHLQKNPRAPYAVVARAVGLDEDDVAERVAALVDEGVISIVAMTDPIQLGYARIAMIGIVVNGPVPPVVDALVRQKHVIYLARTQGGFQVMAEVVGASDAELLEHVARIRHLPGVIRIHTFLEKKLIKEDYTYGGVEVD